MILSILHDTTLMPQENFAEGLDIFTGNVDDSCQANNYYGEIHTGDRWKPVQKCFCGDEGKYMPFGIVIFGDKSHTDLHGTLSVTPVTFTATFFNKRVRNNPESWRPMGYIPNLAYGKSKAKSSEKAQDEHNCLAYVLKSLIDLSEEGGIRTEVMGRNVIVKPFIHYFIGDTEGHNKWLGHYQGTNPGMSRAYRDCHCGFDDLDSPNPKCEYTLASEFRRAVRLVVRNDDATKTEVRRLEAKKDGLQMLKDMSRHCIHNALTQSKLPLSDEKHGANKMCPPESLHVLDAGITMYMQESLQSRISGGASTFELDNLHCIALNELRRQSERDIPRGATRSGLVESTRCQSSERKGNMFVLMVIAHSTDGKMILRHELQYSQVQYSKWLESLKLYLAMEEWFHDARSKDEVNSARVTVAEVITLIKKFFPRADDGYGYKIPKMHALAKMIEYICMFGSAINFYGGPGEASHKTFVKAPGLKTQRRLSEFASQVAEQYYNNNLVTRKACKYLDISIASDVLRDDADHFTQNIEESQMAVEGGYTVDIYPDDTIRVNTRNKHLKKHGLHDTLISVFRRLGAESDGEDGISAENKRSHRFSGYTRATVIGTDGERTTYNAHPYFHGGSWYDWAYVYYEIEEDEGTVAQYYPSKILGFCKDYDDEVHAIIMCSVEPLPWTMLEDKFVVTFKLCSTPGEEQVVPLSSLVDPICVLPDYGSMDADDYMLILPKGQWSDYFGRRVNRSRATM